MGRKQPGLRLYLVQCVSTVHQEGISNALKEFTNKGPSGFAYMHLWGNTLILFNKPFSFRLLLLEPEQQVSELSDLSSFSW